jgi:hypothetical protein
MEDNRYNNKAVLINIKFEEDNFIEYQIANQWDKLIKDIFKRIMVTRTLRNSNHLVY